MGEFRYATVLTGGIATGKSTAAKIFSDLGLEIVDADRIAHMMLDRKSDQIADMFGSKCIDNGKVDRKVLGSIVFSDRVKLAALEEMLHPLIYDEIKRRADDLDMLQKPYLIDIPLFFEKRGYPIKNSILVYAPREMQLQRLMAREGYNLDEANRRIDAQIGIESKRDMATYIINNTKDIKHLEKECKKIAKLL